MKSNASHLYTTQETYVMIYVFNGETAQIPAAPKRESKMKLYGVLKGVILVLQFLRSW